MNISSSPPAASLYAAPITSQPAPVSRNKAGDHDRGSPEAKIAATNEAATKPGSLNVVT